MQLPFVPAVARGETIRSAAKPAARRDRVLRLERHHGHRARVLEREAQPPSLVPGSMRVHAAPAFMMASCAVHNSTPARGNNTATTHSPVTHADSRRASSSGARIELGSR